MPIENLIKAIALTTTHVSLIATGLFGLSWSIASLLRGSPIPFKEYKDFGNGLMIDVIKASFLLAIYSSISSLISWIAFVISLAA